MIVNPAYIYMGKKMPTADLPLWSNTGYNVPATGTDATFSNGTVVIKNGGNISFTVSTFGFKALAVVAESYGYPYPLKMILKVPGKPDYSLDKAIPTSATGVSYEIPAEYQAKNAQLILQDAQYSSGKNIYSAVLKI